MQKAKAILLIGIVFTFGQMMAQPSFRLALQPVQIPSAPGLQSYAYGEWAGEWLLLGGRRDGLHRRQPFAAFDEAGQNDSIYVVNPTSRQVWATGLAGLPTAVAEQLRSTNMQGAQRDHRLYLTGGYGYSATQADHLTYPQLLAIDVPALIQAVKAGSSPAPHIRMLQDERMAVSGGHLALLEGKFYLVGGHRFDGQYNPMNHPTFTQTYTDQARLFDLEDDGSSLKIANYTAWTDANHLHRRDYNLVAQIFPDGRSGLTAFSGVFQPAQDVPWLYPVDLDTGGYTPRPAFTQYLNHYHCGTMSLYEEQENVQHTVFFGGMAQYWLDDTGTLVQDNNVPFVRTIARVSRYADGRLEEVKLPVEMPGLLGSSAEFFRNPEVPAYPNGVIRLDALTDDSLLLGYLFGGILSPQANIFFTNIPSAAVSTVYEVWLDRRTTGVEEQAVSNPLRLLVSPNPSNSDLLINYRLPERAAVRIRLWDTTGRLLGEFDEGERAAGPHYLQLEAQGIPRGYLLVSLVAGKQQTTQKVLLE